jgi:predicted RNA binding protein YcfA (HicA-like mRNA interferase family)
LSEGFYKVVTKELKKLGFEKVKGGKGSHEKWICGSTGKTTIVPHNLKSKHTANGVLKTIGSLKKV